MPQNISHKICISIFHSYWLLFLCSEMFTSLTSYSSSILLDTTKSHGGSKGTNSIYRDELSKKILPKKIKKGDNCLANYKEEDEKNLEKRSYASSVEEKDVITVKVKMTKQEAARLLSKCKGGVLEFKDVAHELAQLPVNRVSVMPSTSKCGYGGVLHSIPEEN